MADRHIDKDFSKQFPKLAEALATYGVVPKAMIDNFPRLLRTIDAGWGASDCLQYIDGLLFTERAGRQGFPNDVIEELLLIKNIFEITFPPGAAATADPFTATRTAEILERVKTLAKAVKQRAADKAAREGGGESSAGSNMIVSAAKLEDALHQLDTAPPLGRTGHTLIGQLLIEAGAIDTDTLNRALAYQNKAPTRHLLGELLLQDNTIKAAQLNEALARQRGVPCVDVSVIEIAPEAIRLVPLRIARMKGAMPVALFDHHLVVAVSDPFDPELLEYFSFLSGSRAQLVFSTPEQIARAQSKIAKSGSEAAGSGDALAARVLASHPGERPGRNIPAEAAEDETLEDDTDAPLPVIDASDPAAIDLLEATLLDAVRVGASDIHFEAFPRARKARVRFRKDGLMEAHTEYPAALHPAVMARLKSAAGLEVTESTRPQSGRMAFADGKRKLDLRVATIPTSASLEAASIRLLTASKPIPLAQLGLYPDTLMALRKEIGKPGGLVLVCGPSGSGKTTTAHSLLRELNVPERRLWTSEDPIEVVQKDITQVQVAARGGWTHAEAVRAFLQADADVILIGEIRDAATAAVATEAAMTGHLVLATMNTVSAAETVGRLLDLGIEPFNLADAILAILTQRLARRLCTACAEQHEYSDEELETLVVEYGLAGSGRAPNKADREKTLARWRAEFPPDEGPLTGKRAMGCAACNGSGYSGRLGIHELMVLTPELRTMVRNGTAMGDVIRQAVRSGMKTLRQDGIEKVVQGLTDLKEVRLVCM